MPLGSHGKPTCRYFKTGPEMFRLAVMLYIRLPLSLRNVEDLQHKRGIELSHETERYWRNTFGLTPPKSATCASDFPSCIT